MIKFLKSSVFSVLSTFSMGLFTLFKGKKVGVDEFGNRYYEAKPRGKANRPRRWVVYNGEIEASKVPPMWHGWLHYQTNTPPSEKDMKPKPWQKQHVTNQTGTENAYLPSGHPLKQGKRAKASGDFEAWSPKK